MTSRFRPLLLLAAALLGACGGKADDRPSGEPAEDAGLTDACALDNEYEFQNIVNFEPVDVDDTDNLVDSCDAVVPCTFYFNYDEVQSPANPSKMKEKGTDCLIPVNPDAVVFTEPRIGDNAFVTELVPEGRCDEESLGLHVVAQNVGMCYGPDGRLGWGAGLDINFATLDMSEWDGIALWVRNGSDARQAFNLSVADRYTSGAPTDPSDPMSLYCSAADGVPDSQKCDAFGTAVTMTGEWTFVPAAFSSMRQKGFGVPSELGQLDPTSVSRLQILMNAGTWDFWIDDIALFRRRE